jgi:cellulose synthase/poly-beta-1,6-N-acetylglucosamine synthase-like glycosyltransferase
MEFYRIISILFLTLVYSPVIVFIALSKVYCWENQTLCVFYDVFNIILIVIISIYYLFLVLTIVRSKYHSKIVHNEIGLSEKWCCIHIPYLKENGEIIEKSLNAVVDSEYKRKIMIITIDGKEKMDIFEKLDNIEYNLDYDKKIYKDGIKIYDGLYKNVPYIVLLKQERTGKRDCQKIIFNLLNWSRGNDTDQDMLNEAIYRKMIKGGVVLQEIKYISLIDADTQIEKQSLGKMINYLEANESCIGVCGETSVAKTYNFWSILQSVEYYLTHKFIKLVENSLGSVFVLSGCFCVMKIDSITDELIIDNTIITEYIKRPEQNNLHLRNLLNIGEDRYLSTLLLVKNKGDIKYLESAKCETICPNTFYSLIKQRKRWTNSMIHCLIHLIKNSKNKITTIIAIIELIIVIMMPMIYIIGIFYALQDITFSIVINLFPIFIMILLRDYYLIPQYFLFLIFQFVFMVFIPLYSFLNQHNTSW